MELLETSKGQLSVPDLPEDIFLLVLKSLDAWDVVRCQKVARSWRRAFLRDIHLAEVLKNYPLAHEVRSLSSGHHDQETYVETVATFNRIASRYYHLGVGKARKLERYKLQAPDQHSQWFPIGQWDYHESQPGGRLYYENASHQISRLGSKPYLFRPTLWSYHAGLVAAAFVDDNDTADDADQIISILNIATGEKCPVPYSTQGKVIRNLSLRYYTLVIEWAESAPFHALNDSEKVHRHFATCYDIIPCDSPSGFKVIFRNEFKLHFLGLPLNLRDRFFSTHNGVHYAIYIWQPNRSMYTGDEDLPIEALAVFNIAQPCPYKPSLDPSGTNLPTEGPRPHAMARFSFRELDFHGVRQHSNITLMSLQLDSDAHSITISENTCVSGQGYFDPAERIMCVVSTTIPFVGNGPAYVRQYVDDLPPYRGHCSMESAPVEDVERCFMPIMDIADEEADVRYGLAETCFTGMVENRLILRAKSLGVWVPMDDEVTREVGTMGRIAGDERWVIGQNAAMELVIAKF